MQASFDCQFAPGDIVVHKRQGYRGVVVEVDEVFKGNEEAQAEYREEPALKNRPWYHVLVDGSSCVTYVSEQSIERDSSGLPVHHPQLASVFNQFNNGRYERPLH